MLITATEFKKNIGKYLEQAQKGDILITKHGVTIAKLSKATPADKLILMDSLVGIAEGLNTDENHLRNERLSRQ